ncbi:hypothetical protein JCM9279_003259 [Rhodotorula babjevae]
MPATKNHLYHSLSPLILLAAFLVSVLAFLTPTPILSDRVSLLEVIISGSRASNARRWIAPDDSVARAYSHSSHGFVKRAKKANSSSTAAATAPVTVKIGPLGACFTNLTTLDQSCMAPSFTPIFVDLYDDVLKLPSSLSSTLPQQFPLTTTALFVSLALLAVQFLAVALSSASMHAPNKLALVNKRQTTLRKAATVCGAVGLVVGLAATGALRVDLGRAVDEAGKVGGVQAKLGPGFNQLFAGLALQAVADALLVAEAFTSNFASVFGLLGFKVKVFKYSGASARGLGSSNSKLGVGAQLVARLEAERPPHVLLQFATVDLAINYLWQLKARGAAASSPHAWTDKVVHDYKAFLASRIVPLAERERMKVYIVAACPPVVEDCCTPRGDGRQKSPDARTLLPLTSASHPHDLATRSLMVRRFNAALGAFCAAHACLAFVDISGELVVDGEEGEPPRVKEEYLDRVDPTNVHLLWEPTLPLWVRAVPPLVHLAGALDAERLGRSAEEYGREKRERVERRREGI